MITVKLTKQAQNDLLKIETSLATSILDKIQWLGENVDSVIHRRLKGKKFGQCFKLGFGDYRIIYKLRQDIRELIILRIGHRKDIYKY